MKQETRQIIFAALPGFILVLLAWLVLGWEETFGENFAVFGVYPRDLKGLRGILFSPLIHGDWQHLFSNTFPMLVLSTCLFYFYREIAKEVLIWMWLIDGFWLWVIGRSSYHIGASGLIYSLAFFLLLSGILRKNKALLAITLIVITFYGSLVWGVFPVKPDVSWEGHLSGLMGGLILALFFRKEGPQADPEKVWDDSDLDGIEPYWEPDNQDIDENARPVHFRYIYRKQEPDGKASPGSELPPE